MLHFTCPTPMKKTIKKTYEIICVRPHDHKMFFVMPSATQTVLSGRWNIYRFQMLHVAAARLQQDDCKVQKRPCYDSNHLMERSRLKLCFESSTKHIHQQQMCFVMIHCYNITKQWCIYWCILSCNPYPSPHPMAVSC